MPEETPPTVDGDMISTSWALTRSLVCRASDAVVASPGHSQGRPLWAALAMGAPLVYATPSQPYDPAGLSAVRVWTSDPTMVVDGTHVELPLPEAENTTPALVDSMQDGEVTGEEIRSISEAGSPSPSLIVLSTGRPGLAPAAAAAAGAVDGEAVWSPPTDLRRRRSLAALAEASERRMLVGDFSAAGPWQIDVLAGGRQLPGGGQVLVPGKRLVAIYGHPDTGALGVLGEQPVAEAVERARQVASFYEAGELEVLPAFEIIATTASAAAGGDGDFSAELSVEDLRPWVDTAGKAGLYVVLDLQSGRADFLTQAQRYEELLRLPHVGLALDPEWRLGSDETHSGPIGTVDAAEVNQVVTWLADLVRQERLPQKLLVVHQFKLSMITNRSQIETPPELAVVIQMDGQGPLATKYETWNALHAADEGGWRWGWKNFYDEDAPLARPEEVLGLDPAPVFISYQ